MSHIVRAELHYRHNGDVPTYASGYLTDDATKSRDRQPVFVVDSTFRHTDPFPARTVVTPESLRAASSVAQEPVVVVLHPWEDGALDFARSSGFAVEAAGY